MKKSKKYYVISNVQKTVKLTAFALGINLFKEIELKLSWIDGQIGACAVFTNKKKAQKYVNSYQDPKPEILVLYCGEKQCIK